MSNMTMHLQAIRPDIKSDLPESRTDAVPTRHGSEYVDRILRQLSSELAIEGDSLVMGVVQSCPRDLGAVIASNLAIRAADYKLAPALVVDADLSRGEVSSLFHQKAAGLSEVVSGGAELQECVAPTRYSRLGVLGRGRNSAPNGLGASLDAGRQLVANLRDSYRFSVLHLPSDTTLSPFELFCRHLDGVIIVASYGASSRRLLELQSRIEQTQGKVRGLVLTGEVRALPRWIERFF